MYSTVLHYKNHVNDDEASERPLKAIIGSG